MRLLAHDSLVQDIDIVALCTTIRFQAAHTVLLRKLGHCTGIHAHVQRSGCSRLYGCMRRCRTCRVNSRGHCEYLDAFQAFRNSVRTRNTRSQIQFAGLMAASLHSELAF